MKADRTSMDNIYYLAVIVIEKKKEEKKTGEYAVHTYIFFSVFVTAAVTSIAILSRSIRFFFVNFISRSYNR